MSRALVLGLHMIDNAIMFDVGVESGNHSFKDFLSHQTGGRSNPLKAGFPER